MPAKTIPLSVRVSDEDADFIAGLDIDGAATPSDKLRAIIAEARRRLEGVEDYTSCLGLMKESLAPAQRRLAAEEHERRAHSELVKTVSDWLPEAMAFLMASVHGARDTIDLVEVEAGLADRVFVLLEAVMRMGVTRRCPCYAQDAVRARLEPILELAQLILEKPRDKEEER